MPFPDFLIKTNCIIPVHPLMLTIPLDSLKKGLPYPKCKMIYEKGYRQFGLVLGKKSNLMALVSHKEPLPQFEKEGIRPHISGPPYIYFFKNLGAKDLNLNPLVEIIQEGVVLLPPSRPYLHEEALTWISELSESNLLLPTALAHLFDLPKLAVKTPIYSYLYRPDGLTLKRPPEITPYDKEQWSIYKDSVIKLVFEKHASSVTKIPAEHKARYLQEFIQGKEEYLDLAVGLEKFIPEAAENELENYLSRVYLNTPNLLALIPLEYRP